jgi:pyridoxine/pyridoxamine 5'-phosphate oxidase
VVLNWFGNVGPIPEGMSATTALRVQRLTSNHAVLKARLLEKAEQFKTEKGYVPPYWELVRLAREAKEAK